MPMGKVGSCLIVAGGYCTNDETWTNTLMEVLDVQWRHWAKWLLHGHLVSDCLLVFGRKSFGWILCGIIGTDCLPKTHECCLQIPEISY